MVVVVISSLKPRRINHIRQSEIAECGLACVAMIAGYYGTKLDLITMRREFSTSMRGSSLRDLSVIADRLNFIPRAIKVSLDELIGLHLPAILHWDMNHFVVLEKISRGKARIVDPAALGVRHILLSDLSDHFTGVALELRPATNFVSADKQQKLHFWQLWDRAFGWKRAVAQAFTLTLILQTILLISPYFLQIVVDHVIPNYDPDLLLSLALGFGVLTVFNAGSTLLRNYVLLSAGASISYALTSNLVRRMFRLPVPWFERRDIGDVLSRFQSVHPIQDALTQGVISSIFDGVLAGFTFILMALYSVKLAAISLAALLIYTGIRLVSFRIEREAREAMIASTAKEQTTLVESLRGIITLRLFGREADRHLYWQDRLAKETDAAVRVSRVNAWQSALNILVFGIENILAVWMAAKLAMSAEVFSVGMIVAYLAYKQQLVTRATSLIDQAIAFKMLNLHVGRLGDIALQPEDRAFAPASRASNEFRGHVQLRGIRYRYSENERWLLDQINLDLPPGAHIAITGPSGGGKSTLAKIILGLDDPQEGVILIDGVPLPTFGYQHFRSAVAAVLQEDNLFSGSIAENISFFDSDIDLQKLHRVAEMAAIHTDIVAMPMRYETLVGDMGSTLSGGQKARVLLARALYREPKLLLLDEGSAHLDPETERYVNRAISRLGITRIVIAHRAETIRNADVAFALVDGRLREMTNTRSHRS